MKKFKLFGYCFVKEEDFNHASNSEVERLKLIVERDEFKARVRDLESKLEAINTARPVIDVNLGDPSPTDSKSRKMYVAAVAGLHKDILGPKIKQMISKSHSLLSESTNTRDEDLSLKGAVYGLWELYNWGEKMINEQMSYQSEGVASAETKS